MKRIHPEPIPAPYPARLDAAALDYFRRVSLAGSSVTVNRGAVDRLIRDLKAAGLWDKLGTALLLAGPDTLAGALVPLRAGMPTPTNYNFVAADHARATGLRGNLSAKYVTTGLPGSSLPNDDAHHAVWVVDAHSGAAVGCYIGNARTSAALGATLLSRSGATPTSLAISLHGGVTSSVGGGAATGLIGCSRSAPAGYVVRHTGGDIAVGSTSAAPLARPITLFRLDEAAGYSNARLAWASAGLALDLAALDAALSAYMARLV